jgi:predicted DNA-binding transcriptional regulator AlpA
MARLTVIQAASYIPLSKSNLDKLRVAGGGPRYIKIGKRVLYDQTDLDRWIDEHKQASTADLPSARRPLRRVR